MSSRCWSTTGTRRSRRRRRRRRSRTRTPGRIAAAARLDGRCGCLLTGLRQDDRRRPRDALVGRASGHDRLVATGRRRSVVEEHEVAGRVRGERRVAEVEVGRAAVGVAGHARLTAATVWFSQVPLPFREMKTWWLIGSVGVVPLLPPPPYRMLDSEKYTGPVGGDVGIEGEVITVAVDQLVWAHVAPPSGSRQPRIAAGWAVERDEDVLAVVAHGHDRLVIPAHVAVCLDRLGPGSAAVGRLREHDVVAVHVHTVDVTVASGRPR